MPCTPTSKACALHVLQGALESLLGDSFDDAAILEKAIEPRPGAEAEQVLQLGPGQPSRAILFESQGLEHPPTKLRLGPKASGKVIRQWHCHHHGTRLTDGVPQRHTAGGSSVSG